MLIIKSQKTCQGKLHSLVKGAYQQVVCVVKRGLLIIERGEPHALEMPPVTLLPPHHDPHGSPLCYVHRLNDQGDLVNETDGSSDMVQYPHVFDLQYVYVI